MRKGRVSLVTCAVVYSFKLATHLRASISRWDPLTKGNILSIQRLHKQGGCVCDSVPDGIITDAAVHEERVVQDESQLSLLQIFRHEPIDARRVVE